MRVISFDPVRILQVGLRASAVWKSSSINRKITSSVLIIAAATLLVRSLTAGREIVVAYHFGTSDAIDAFVIAFVVPSFVFSIVVGSIRSSLIPTFVRISDNDGELAASRMASNVMAAIMAVSVALTAFHLADRRHADRLPGIEFLAGKKGPHRQPSGLPAAPYPPARPGHLLGRDPRSPRTLRRHGPHAGFHPDRRHHPSDRLTQRRYLSAAGRHGYRLYPAGALARHPFRASERLPDRPALVRLRSAHSHRFSCSIFRCSWPFS